MRSVPVLIVLALAAAACGADASVAVGGIERSAETVPSTASADVASTAPSPTATSAPSNPAAPGVAPPAIAPAPPSATAGAADRQATGGGTAAGRLNSDGTPVFDGDFADPFVLVVDGSFFAYATNTLSANIPVLWVAANGDGAELDDALPDLPAWSEPGHVWAPAVVAAGSGYLLYYSTRHSESGRQCISVALSDSPAGPFVDSSSEPFICDLAQGGSIDPSTFVDVDGRRWLLWKSDGNCCGMKAVVYVQPLTNSGLEVAGDAVELIRNDRSWEGDVVEAPSMIEFAGRYHLFYSGNRWDTAYYAVGHAVCETVAGPCVKDEEPWFDANSVASGPGGLEVVALDGQPVDLVVYHGWTDGAVGYDKGQRGLFVSPIRWEAGQPVLVIDV